ncbi:aldo/keto reductase [Latilactobacillus curvatus]|uniref:Oxidoreductase n=1 Tax=Latilactobacillus curvatus TaxID=28038 RepID=A0ABN6GHU5_LATCU|nr:aldo/keto reductase [Latilactobacillus curvatus]AOO76136.1 oxidoreductase [Latilactobacillus curvatus]QEA49113.1 aldo/keto reductase [Latilactobacillus curvatus]WBY48748.1 aldo/keto reductase [Latilactobacillus curvatus]WIE00677.1 aldo/keto reductase [Latilactobacillus curvatus]BCX30445.1 oxidoreductase [Latilactobacillus curvatus]
MQKLSALTAPMTLSNGVTILGLGYGTYQTPNEETKKAVLEALSVGYRHIDTAAVYGNEQGVGAALKESDIAREDIFVTSKLWNTERGYDATKAAFAQTIATLGVDYLDLYLIHWPANTKQFEAKDAELNAETWRAMEDLYNEGKIRAIGVSNFMPHHLDALMKTAVIKPMADQIEVHPGWPQAEAVRYNQVHDILVEVWAPLGEASALSNETIATIATKHGKTAAQVCLRWGIQQGVLPLPKSTHQERMAQNTDIFDFELTDSEMTQISALENLGGQCMVPDDVDF